VKKSKATGKQSENLEAGRYILGVLQIISRVTEQKGLVFIAKMLVLKSEYHGAVDPDNLIDGKPKVIVPAPVGVVRGYVLLLDKHRDTAPGNVKAYMLELVGLTEDDGDTLEDVEIDGKKVQMSKLEIIGEGAAGEEQQARGMLIACETRMAKVKKGDRAGKHNHYPQWTHIGDEPTATEFGGNSDEDVARRRAEWDKTHPIESVADDE
jgi:hypothetical protein